MARKETVSSVTTLLEAGEIVLTEEQRKCEELIVRVNLNARPVEVGVLDLEKTIPRQWYGYAYLIHKNSIVKVCPLDFENLTIYRKELLWKAEIAIQTAVQLINVPNAEPGTVTEQAAVFNLLTSQENNGAYYFPFPQPIDKIVFWFPVGVSIDVVIDYRPWSDILNPDGSIAIPTLPNVEEDDLLELPALGTVDPAVTFKDTCIAAFPDNFVPDTPIRYVITYTVFSSVLPSGQGVRSFVMESTTPVGLVGVPSSGQGVGFTRNAWANSGSAQGCNSALAPLRQFSATSQYPFWAIQLLEWSGGQDYLMSISEAAVTIDYDSITIQKCS